MKPYYQTIHRMTIELTQIFIRKNNNNNNNWTNKTPCTSSTSNNNEPLGSDYTFYGFLHISFVVCLFALFRRVFCVTLFCRMIKTTISWLSGGKVRTEHVGPKLYGWCQQLSWSCSLSLTHLLIMHA